MTVHIQVPDLAFRLPGGREISLSDFEGQKLALFCAPDGDFDSFQREVGEYTALVEEFADSGTWVLGVTRGEVSEMGLDASNTVRTAGDPDGSGIDALRSCLGAEGVGTDGGATLVIDRDGTIRAAWPSGGHARDALEAAREHP
ncbi:MAG: redoxin domain-containing protein [Allosphingosinicella sp.]